MDEQYSMSRNTTEGFARRVRNNLDFIAESRANGERVHEVTQLVLSLLGIVVFPWEAKALKQLESLPLRALWAEGWPKWDVLLDENGDTETLGKLIWHVRNAASHVVLDFRRMIAICAA